MMEMALVSFNKLRLQYYVSQKIKWATWISNLLKNPSKLFGTTLIGVNLANIISSECARELYASLGLSPDLAPLTQVAIVVIFGELAPMFAARSYAENVTKLGSPFLYASSILMTPLLFLVEMITKGCNLVMGGKGTDEHIFLTQDELQKVLEEHEEMPTYESDSEEFNAIAANIFSLRHKTAKELMQPIKDTAMLPSSATISEVHTLLKKEDLHFVPIYHQVKTNIIGIALPRDLIRPTSTKKVREYARPPWFVTQHTKAMELLQQFRINNQSTAVILDKKGMAVGVCDLEDVTEEIFGVRKKASVALKPKQVIERTFSGDMLVSEFNEMFDVVLDERGELTLSQLLTELFGHHPEEGQSYYLEPFELIVKEAALMEVKKVIIKTKMSTQ